MYNKKRVLIISTIGLYKEGMTSVIYNYSSKLYDDYLFSFVAYEDIDLELKEKFDRIGEIVFLPNRKKNTLKYIKHLNNILKQKYDVVHVHGNSGTMALEVMLSKINKTKKIITHSHNSRCEHPFLNYVLRYPMMLYSNKNISVSKEAGEWLYGKNKYEVLNNAIDVKKYAFNKLNREIIRKKHNIKKELVFGNIGRYCAQKNQLYIIDIFVEIIKQYKNAKLLLMGYGPDEDKIKSKILELNITKQVILIDSSNKAEQVYSAIDIFLFPSIYEGFGISVIEAECNGLNCVVSTAVPKSTKCSDGISYVSLEDKNTWINEILKYTKQNSIKKRIENSKRNIDMATKKGFNINKEYIKLAYFYDEK